MRLPRAPIATLVALVLVSGSTASAGVLAAGAALPPLPGGWPKTFELGMADGLGDAAGIARSAPFALRSQYLAGGVNTGNGWASWAPAAAFVTQYAQESFEHGITPVFDYYMLLQSRPSTGKDEGERDFANLTNAQTMAAYYADLRLFFERAGALGRRHVILHFEPDLWGFAQQRAPFNDAGTVMALVGSTHVEGLTGLPDSVAGLAQAVISLRDRYAPNVLIAYHLSVWGTNEDILYSHPDDEHLVSLAQSATFFYRSLHANFDIVFTDTSDRDAAYRQYQYHDLRAWWTKDDYARHARLLGTFASRAGKRVVLWQTPLGNTKMRAQNNSWGHYQDNHVEWLLDDPGGAHLSAYMSAGVVAAIFGGGGAGTTCACDAANDGVTDPPAINGNDRFSLNADDDGGYFRARAATFYAAGGAALPNGPAEGSVATGAVGCVMAEGGDAGLCPRMRRRRIARSCLRAVRPEPTGRLELPTGGLRNHCSTD